MTVVSFRSASLRNIVRLTIDSGVTQQYRYTFFLVVIRYQVYPFSHFLFWLAVPNVLDTMTADTPVYPSVFYKFSEIRSLALDVEDLRDEATKYPQMYPVIRENFPDRFPEFEALVTERLSLTLTEDKNFREVILSLLEVIGEQSSELEEIQVDIVEYKKF